MKIAHISEIHAAHKYFLRELAELDDRKRGAIDIRRISARGEQELVFSRGHEEDAV